ncbi:hypothetical protein Leryth_016033 [Lithospermum erythrorhizon]|nr:hypothetical protein Leryth_016033 [Lithospermum erythrorhizon]
MSHSLTVPEATDNPDVLQRITTQLFASFSMDVKDIRGMGLQVSKLKEADNAKQGSERSSIRSWLLASSAKTRGQPNIGPSDETASAGWPSNRRESGFYNGESSTGTGASHPPMHELDVGVLECLPSEVLSEINDMYGGKLLSFISQSKKENGCSSDIPTSGPGSVLGMKSDKDKPYSFYAPPDSEGNLSDRMEIKLGPVSDEGMSKTSPCAVNGITSFMPSSLSQVDTSVLQQLPEDLRTDILDLLPAHRIPEAEVDVPLNVENKTPSGYSTPGDNLWVGSPPCWIDKFKASNCSILNMFAELYFKSGSGWSIVSYVAAVYLIVCFEGNYS